MDKNEMKQELMDIANSIVQHSGGRATLAFSGDGHFIELDGSRISRDIELYVFMGKVAGWEQTLAMFLEEVLLPVKFLGLFESYKVAGEKLKRLGQGVYSAEIIEEWNSLF